MNNVVILFYRKNLSYIIKDGHKLDTTICPSDVCVAGNLSDISFFYFTTKQKIP